MDCAPRVVGIVVDLGALAKGVVYATFTFTVFISVCHSGNDGSSYAN